MLKSSRKSWSLTNLKQMILLVSSIYLSISHFFNRNLVIFIFKSLNLWHSHIQVASQFYSNFKWLHSTDKHDITCIKHKSVQQEPMNRIGSLPHPDSASASPLLQAKLHTMVEDSAESEQSGEDRRVLELVRSNQTLQDAADEPNTRLNKAQQQVQLLAVQGPCRKAECPCATRAVSWP
jgi:hypothetical protein